MLLCRVLKVIISFSLSTRTFKLKIPNKKIVEENQNHNKAFVLFFDLILVNHTVKVKKSKSSKYEAKYCDLK